MVGNLRPNDSRNFSGNNQPNTDNTNNNSNNSNVEILERIIHNHNIDHSVIRNLIRRAIDPLPVGVIPSRVTINDIIITRNQLGQLSMRCEVTYHFIRN